MNTVDLQAWQLHMGLAQRAAADALGVTHAAYSAMVLGKSRIDRRTALACAALAAGLEPWPNTARTTGMEYRVAHGAVTRCKVALDLAAVASTGKREVFAWYDPTAQTLHKTAHDDGVRPGAQLWPLHR